jgi:hypothetical protein
MVSINLMYYLLICILCSCGNNRGPAAPLILSDKKSMITKEEVLESLDEHGKFHMYEFFPNLNDGLMYLGGVKMNVYGDGRRWAIVFEKFGFNNRNWSIDHLSYYFGNCLQNMEVERENGRRVWSNVKVKQVVTPEEVSDLCEYLYFLKPGIDSIMINNQTFAIEQDVKKLKKMGIEIMKTGNPSINLPIDFSPRPNDYFYRLKSFSREFNNPGKWMPDFKQVAPADKIITIPKNTPNGGDGTPKNPSPTPKPNPVPAPKEEGPPV